MMAQITVDKDKIVAFCRQNGIQRIAFFGSVLGPAFRADSDIDVLVSFAPDAIPGLFGIARLERELTKILGGRHVDLRTPEDLSRYFRDRVIAESEVLYEAN